MVSALANGPKYSTPWLLYSEKNDAKIMIEKWNRFRKEEPHGNL